MRGGRTFCRHLYNLHKVAIQKHFKGIRLSPEAQADISWWLEFIRIFNGKCTVKKVQYGLDMISDSSRLGYGVYLGGDWLYGSWEGKEMFNSECNHLCEIYPELSDSDRVNINVLELWPVLMGIKRRGNAMAGKLVNVVVDNLQVSYMMKTGRSVNHQCMVWLRELFWECVKLDLELKPVYIRSEDNILADTLSHILYKSTSMKLPDLLSSYDMCCKDGFMLFFRNHLGSTHSHEDKSHEEISSPVYIEE